MNKLARSHVKNALFWHAYLSSVEHEELQELLIVLASKGETSILRGVLTLVDTLKRTIDVRTLHALYLHCIETDDEVISKKIRERGWPLVEGYNATEMDFPFNERAYITYHRSRKLRERIAFITHGISPLRKKFTVRTTKRSVDRWYIPIFGWKYIGDLIVQNLLTVDKLRPYIGMRSLIINGIVHALIKRGKVAELIELVIIYDQLPPLQDDVPYITIRRMIYEWGSASLLKQLPFDFGSHLLHFNGSQDRALYEDVLNTTSAAAYLWKGFLAFFPKERIAIVEKKLAKESDHTKTQTFQLAIVHARSAGYTYWFESLIAKKK